MKRLIEQRYVVRQNLIAIVGICLSFYFCYHILAGERSYLRLMSLERQITKVSTEYDGLSAERLALEEKVVMLRPGSINRDLLEERVRHVLGYHRADERVLLQGRS